MTIKVTWEPGYDRLPRLQWALDAEDAAAYERFGVVHELTGGERIFEQGKVADALYVVLEGEVGILKDGAEIARVGQNLSFGEMGLLLARPRSASARAITDSRVLELSRADIDRMLDEDPVWAARLYRVLAETLAEYLSISARESS